MQPSGVVVAQRFEGGTTIRSVDALAHLVPFVVGIVELGHLGILPLGALPLVARSPG